MAFKADIDDARNSLSYNLKNILIRRGASVICSDEYIQNPAFVSKEHLISKSDVIVIGVLHKQYKKINFKDKKIINIWRYEN